MSLLLLFIGAGVSTSGADALPGDPFKKKHIGKVREEYEGLLADVKAGLYGLPISDEQTARRVTLELARLIEEEDEEILLIWLG